METLRSRYNKLSPLKRVAALGGIGLALFFGGKTVDHYDGPEQSAVAETLTLFGSVSMLAAGLSGAGYGLGRQVEQLSRRDLERQQREIKVCTEAALEGLPRNMGEVDFGLLMDTLSVRERRAKSADEVQALNPLKWYLMSTRVAVASGIGYSHKLKAFSDDIGHLVDVVADARSGAPAARAQISVSDTEAVISPDSSTRAEEGLRHVASFLDEVVPLERQPDMPTTWNGYLSGRVGLLMIDRLIDKPEPVGA